MIRFTTDRLLDIITPQQIGKGDEFEAFEVKVEVELIDLNRLVRNVEPPSTLSCSGSTVTGTPISSIAKSLLCLRDLFID